VKAATWCPSGLHQTALGSLRFSERTGSHRFRKCLTNDFKPA
jgi:hypothetical protein